MQAFLASIGYDSWVLPVLLIIPVVGAIFLLATGRGVSSAEIEQSSRSARIVAFGALMLEFLVSLGLWWTFDPANAGWQSAIDAEWIPQWGVRFTLGIDGI